LLDRGDGSDGTRRQHARKIAAGDVLK
jgi:hypothetical protein